MYGLYFVHVHPQMHVHVTQTKQGPTFENIAAYLQTSTGYFKCFSPLFGNAVSLAKINIKVIKRKYSV